MTSERATGAIPEAIHTVVLPNPAEARTPPHPPAARPPAAIAKGLRPNHCGMQPRYRVGMRGGLGVVLAFALAIITVSPVLGSHKQLKWSTCCQPACGCGVTGSHAGWDSDYCGT